MPIQIVNVDCLTDEFIRGVDDELLLQTYGVKAFGTVEIFLNKIKDKMVRYTMMKSAFQLM